MRRRAILTAVALLMLGMASAEKKTVYVSYILHGNMNYDRYVRPTIWKEFPHIYDGLLDFMDEHPDFKGQLQFSGQTLGSLLQTAPEVAQHALDIHRRGQLNFTGTFYSEPVNVNMNGETNYRCAWLGTKIVEDFTGERTDGFYLQERAYHPQLPWILSHSNVSWTPVITGDDSWKPFRLRGMDGTSSVCVPITPRDALEKLALEVPANSLFTIEEDYEIPQSFTHTYHRAVRFNEENEDVKLEWITVKEYIERFGVGEEKYIDHSAKAKNRDNGTYSRWTADPLDIITQHFTNEAMSDFRSAQIFNALLSKSMGFCPDLPLNKWDGTYISDPLAWDIERAELYPEVEPKYLKHNGEVTMLSRAEHLLLWGVNSDAKGWYPLYEKRRERQNSFFNCSYLSQDIIHRGMDHLASGMRLKGYEKYYLLMNMEAEGERTLCIESPQPLELFDLKSGERLPQQCVRSEKDATYITTFRAHLPSFGYTTLGARTLAQSDKEEWHAGYSIKEGKTSLTANSEGLVLEDGEHKFSIGLDEFQIKALTEMNDGKGDEEWRKAQPFGEPRISVCTSGLNPRMRIDWQLDWLLHLHALLTLDTGRLFCDLSFTFPHPTLLRHDGKVSGNTFNPEGLNLLVKSEEACTVGYDIPFGISEYDQPGTSYFCALSSCFLQHKGHGLLVSPRTGEQAFSVDTDKGEMKVYMGASTTSGPIRNVGLSFRNPTEVDHEPAWYSEPFHGEYLHRIILSPYDGSWREAHLPSLMQKDASKVYIREVRAGKSRSKQPLEKSFIQCKQPNVELTMMELQGDSLVYRLNEREGQSTEAEINILGTEEHISLAPFGIGE